MKNIKTIIVAIATAVVVLSGCSKIRDFGDINYSPNSPSTAYTDYMFTYACKYVPYFSLGSATNAYDVWQQEWPGYMSESKNNQYGPLGNTITYSGVTTMYLYPLKNLDKIIKMNEDPETKDLLNVTKFGSTANQIAVAKTLSAYYYMSLTDIVGPIILSEAFQGETEDNWQPKYDTQESVYKQLDDMLNAAYSQFDEGSSLSSADIIYNGNITKWKKFNASLRMSLAIKLSDVAEAEGRARFQKAYSDGGLESAADDFTFTYDDLNWNMLYYWCNKDYSSASKTPVPNKFIVDQMKELKDPRTFKYFDLVGYRGNRDPEVFPEDSYDSFYGVPFGLVDNNAVASWVSCCCCFPQSLSQKNSTVPIIPAARILLTEAEAAYRGWISADAQALYEAGIKASFDQWGAADADKYIKSEGVAYDPSNGLEQIAIQRWIATYLADGVEAWSDWRRLDIPHLPVGPGAANNGKTHYPYRLGFYADNDVSLNGDNVAIAAKDLSGGVDNVDNRVWWDVKDNWEGVLSDEECKPAIVFPPKWEEVCTGTLYFMDEVVDIFGESMETTLYMDANHEGEYKLAPWGNGKEYCFQVTPDGLIKTSARFDSGYTLETGEPIYATEWDYDQASENNYSGILDDGSYDFANIYRYKNSEGKLALWAYGGDDIFVPNK